jgi:DNA-binding CsgD family transcriptional regulator
MDFATADVATGKLRSNQVRRLLGLIAETREMSPERDEGPRHLISGLLDILGAAVGGCLVDCDFRPEGRGAFTAVVLAGWDRSTLPVLEVLGKTGNAFNPGIRALMRACPAQAGGTLTASRQQLVDDRAWYGSPYVEHYVAPAHLDHALYSSKRAGAPGVVHGLGFYRAKNDRPFDEEDRNLLYLFHLECQRMLHGPTTAVDTTLRSLLSPRERHTLDLLLSGLADKEIAQRLGISPHTVNHYTKSIYRRFGVGGRVALMARLLGRRPAAGSGASSSRAPTPVDTP